MLNLMGAAKLLLILLFPHFRSYILLFLANGIGVDRRSAELGVPHPLLKHVQRNAVHRGIYPKPMAQAFWAAVWRVRYPGLNHNAFDNLPYADAAERPDRFPCLFARLLSFPDAMGSVEGVQIIRRHRDGPIDDFRAARCVLALLEAADGDRPTRQVHAGRGDLEQF